MIHNFFCIYHFYFPFIKSSYNGDISLNFVTAFFNTSTSTSTSSFVFSFPKVTLSEPCANSWLSPRAISTCDGSKLPLVHALPDDANILLLSKYRSKDSPSINWKDILAFPGSLLYLSPFNLMYGIVLNNESI